MTIFSNNAKYGVDPEQFINAQFVDSEITYKEMMAHLVEHNMVILDSETVGNGVLEKFIEQLEIEKQYESLYKKDPGFIIEGLNALDEARRLKREYETYLKEAYTAKTITLGILNPDQRTILTERRKTLKTVEKDYETVISYEKLLNLHEKMQKQIDGDETGLMFHRNILSLVQIGTLDGTQFLIDPKILIGKEDFKEYLRSRTAIIGMNLKFDLIQLEHHLGITFDDVPVWCYDVMLAAKVIRSGLMRRFALKELAREFLGYEQSKEERISYWLRRPLKPEQTKYAALDVIIPGLLFYILKAEIKEKNLVDSAKLQMDFLKVLTKIELTGIYVDLKKTENLVEEVNKKTEAQRKKIADALGDVVWYNPDKGHNEIKTNKDLNSPKETLAQLKNYGRKHGILPLQWLTGTGKDAFEEIEDKIDILDYISEFRSLLHTKENYCNAILNYHVDSRIHSSYVQIQKEGTRMSSNKPNVQNISRPGIWDPSKHATWQEAFESWTPKEKLRTLFVAAPGRKLYDADYGAIELCMIAYYSQDAIMLKALIEGVDLHALTANRIFNLGYTYEQLSDKKILKEFKQKYGKERQIAKTFNFAVVYGAGPAKLRRQLMIEANIYDMSEEELRTMRDEWFKLYPGVKTWQDNTLHVAKHYGYCTTRMGREIYFEDPSKVYSKAFNTPIQASCFEGLQLAALMLDKKIKYLVAVGLIKPNSIQIVNLVHDEFVVEADENINEQSINKLIVESMIEGMQPLMEYQEIDDKIYEKVPVSVDCGRILQWSDK